MEKTQTKNLMRNKEQVMALMLSGALLAGCDKNDRSFSVLSETQQFQQSTAYSQRTTDVLWVIDNSGSMANSQANLRNNMLGFIDKFSELGMDYRMAVTSTEAWLGDPEIQAAYPVPADLTFNFPGFNLNKALYRDGCAATPTNGCLGKTSIYMMNPQNTIDSSGNPTNVFSWNTALGVSGGGDERAFSSMLAALKNPSNKALGFPRPGSFLSVIILSDEDDYSGTLTERGAYFLSNAAKAAQSAPLLQPVDYYVNQMDQIMGGKTNYSVSGIFIRDAACLAALSAGSSGRVIGARYQEMVTKTNGTAGSLCDTQFYQALTEISQKALELTSTFVLARAPIPTSIVVSVNQVSVPNSDVNGWVYLADQNAVQFRGNAVPAQGASISINYDPLTAMN